MRTLAIVCLFAPLLSAGLAGAQDTPRVWTKFQTQAAPATVASAACSLEMKAAIEGRNRPIDVRAIGDSTCTSASHDDALHLTVTARRGADVIVELEVPVGVTAKGREDLRVALRAIADKLRQLAAAPAPVAPALERTNPYEGVSGKEPAGKEPPPDEPAATPPAPLLEARIHHAPPATIPAHEKLVLRARVDRPDLAPRVLVVYEGEGGQGEVAFERTEDGFAATIPADAVKSPNLAYAIEAEPSPGKRTALFATRAAMQPVRVMDDIADAREEASLTRLDRRRSLITASSEYAFFGVAQPSASVLAQDPNTGPVRDEFWRVDASYTYRILRRVTEFGIGGGVVRGSSLVPDAKSAKDYDVGLNYGAVRIRLRIVDWLHTDLKAQSSITERGFSPGFGGTIILGDPIGNRLTLGGDGIVEFGVRGWARVDVVAGSRAMIGPTVEVTTMPHASVAGVRLLLDARLAIVRGFAITARVGYQARSFDQGGVALGGGAEFAF